jgi:transposase
MPSPNRKNRTFDRVFKQNAVRMVLDQGMSQEEVALKLDVGRTAMSRWVKQYKRSPQEAFRGNSKRPDKMSEVAVLRRQLKKAQDERDILKKALLIFSRPKNNASSL